MSDSIDRTKFRALPAFGRYLRVLTRHSLPSLAFILLAMIAGLAVALFTVWIIYRVFFDNLASETPANPMVVVLPLLAGLFLGAATAPPLAAQAAACEQEGRRAGFGEAWSSLWRHGPATLPILVAQAVLAGLGFVLMIFPGFIASVVVSLAVPARVTEGVGPFRALSRSVELTEGVRWRLFGYLCGTGALVPVTFISGIAAFSALAEMGEPAKWAETMPLPLYVTLNIVFALALLGFFSLVAYLSALGPAAALAEIRARQGARGVSEIFD